MDVSEEHEQQPEKDSDLNSDSTLARSGVSMYFLLDQASAFDDESGVSRSRDRGAVIRLFGLTALPANTSRF